jgi:hypothetical protein
MRFHPLAWANAVAILMHVLSASFFAKEKLPGNPTTAAKPFPSKPGMGMAFLLAFVIAFMFSPLPDPVDALTALCQ